MDNEVSIPMQLLMMTSTVQERIEACCLQVLLHIQGPSFFGVFDDSNVCISTCDVVG